MKTNKNIAAKTSEKDKLACVETLLHGRVNISRFIFYNNINHQTCMTSLISNCDLRRVIISSMKAKRHNNFLCVRIIGIAKNNNWYNRVRGVVWAQLHTHPPTCCVQFSGQSSSTQALRSSSGQTGQGGSNYQNTQIGRLTRDRAVQKCTRVMIVAANVSSHNVLNRLILVLGMCIIVSTGCLK